MYANPPYDIHIYSRTSLMWTAEGRTKSVHNGEVSTLVKLGVATDHTTAYIGKTKRAGRKVSTVVGCPQGEVLLYLKYCRDPPPLVFR